MSKPIRAFLIYSTKDFELRDEIQQHIKILIDIGILNFWSDKEIKPGDYWDNTIKEQLLNTDVFFLLVSVDFYNSDYIQKEEFKIAKNRLDSGSSIIIPIIVRDCNWKMFPTIKDLQVLPPEGIPVSDLEHWKSKDKVWRIVIEKIADRIQELLDKRAEIEKRQFEDKKINLQKSLGESELLERKISAPRISSTKFFKIQKKLMDLKLQLLSLEREKRDTQNKTHVLDKKIIEIHKEINGLEDSTLS